MLESEKLVNSCTEWEPLQEVIVAKLPDDACFPPNGPYFRGECNNEYIAATLNWPKGPRHPNGIQKANMQYDVFADMLEGEGVVVKRPTLVPQNKPIATPYWSTPTMYNVCPRDKLLVVGREILEAAMSFRTRLFEEYCYRDLIMDYYRRDKGMIWTAAPKPMMRNSLYQHAVDIANGMKTPLWDRVKNKMKNKKGLVNPEDVRSGKHNFEFATTEDEPVWDAADVVRFGKDLFVMRSNTTNLSGYEWLRRHFATRGVDCHLMHFPDDISPQHIDGNFVPLRPGFVLCNRERPPLEWELTKFREGNWNLIESAAPSVINYPMPDFCYCSANGLSCNVFSISPEKVAVEENEKPLITQLEDYGFDVIPVAYRDTYQFGGGLQCSTNDIRRVDQLKDYFAVDYN
ncbi:Glycine amidinotransferase, mitochondrial [Gracilariopsis chorda]|uniref:Glycine amidinotransferase, mitochondrial n=1 Tax=Gracilariopsis chorda TaxID=448386 RepID=A0A2V3J5R2_9FLOR|nr:Glycine amidinotransferase, mitochondrial [Gracilariopsis chorda]|eukprot:PXF49768.1 Glycine amidinotransferase, mitochondrial [Gracilariopsis chorda]